MYVQNDKLLLADVFNNCQNMCLEIHGLVLLIFFCTGISVTSILKKDQSKIRSIN